MTTDVAVWGQGGSIPGLDGFSLDHSVIPRISIDHESGKLKDNLSEEMHDTLDVVVLGIQVQRILWPVKMGESDKPLCKSRNGVHGLPLLEGTPKFNFRESNFTEASLATDAHGNQILPCEACSLKDWTKDPSDPTRNVQPRCAEQFTFILETQDGGNALFTVQRTGLKSARRYLTGFKQRQQPTFICRTTIGVAIQGSARRQYGTPTFTKGPATDQEAWPEYAETVRDLISFLTTPPQRGNDADSDATKQAAGTSATMANQNHPAAAPNVAVPSDVIDSTVVNQAPAPADDDDDLPF